jgi:hypothetical protein
MDGVMDVPTSVRLDKETEIMLEETARILRKSKTEVIKPSLSDYCSHIIEESKKKPYALIKDLLDPGGSGKGDLALRSEEILRSRLRRKRYLT